MKIFPAKILAVPCFFQTLWKRNKARALARFAWPENNSSMNKFVEKTNIEDLDECAILPRPLLLRQRVEPHPLLAHKHNHTPSMNSHANSAYHMSAWIKRRRTHRLAQGAIKRKEHTHDCKRVRARERDLLTAAHQGTVKGARKAPVGVCSGHYPRSDELFRAAMTAARRSLALHPSVSDTRL